MCVLISITVYYKKNKKIKSFFRSLLVLTMYIVLSIATVIYGIISFWHGFQKFEVSHIHKNGNHAAHLLAKHVQSIEHYTWIEESPYFLEYALSNDVISFSSI